MSLLNETAVRLGTPDDVGFVVVGWERSHREAYTETRHSTYGRALKTHVNQLLESGACLYVIHPQESPSVLWGFVLGQPPSRIDYFYVVPDVRRLGMARKLVTEAGYDFGTLNTFTRLTRIASAIRQRHPFEVLPRF